VPAYAFDTLMHGYRVRVGGFDGQPGVLLHCRSKRTGGHYWKVKLDGGRGWEWPNHLVIESTGAYVHRCGQCELEYRGNEPNGHLCPECVKDIEKQAGEGSPWHGPSHQFGRRPRRS
jgi:hypothetical protein